MNFWTFLDRHMSDILFVVLVMLCLGSCSLVRCTEGYHQASGCGTTISIGSKPTGDAGPP